MRAVAFADQLRKWTGIQLMKAADFQGPIPTVGQREVPNNSASVSLPFSNDLVYHTDLALRTRTPYALRLRV